MDLFIKTTIRLKTYVNEWKNQHTKYSKMYSDQ